MVMGRPTKYNEQMLEDARDYLASYTDDGEVVPTKHGLALKLKVALATLDNWAAEHEDFLGVLDEIEAEQAQKLIAKGLTGEFVSPITKLMLGKHGYSEKSAHEVSGPGGGPVKTVSKIEFVGVSSDDAD